jgi:hypothetical protein
MLAPNDNVDIVFSLIFIDTDKIFEGTYWFLINNKKQKNKPTRNDDN